MRLEFTNTSLHITPETDFEKYFLRDMMRRRRGTPSVSLTMNTSLEVKIVNEPETEAVDEDAE